MQQITNGKNKLKYMHKNDKKMRKVSKRYIFFYISAGVLCVTLFLYFLGRFDLLDQKTLDLRFRLRGERKPDDRIVIVAVDEKSIDKIGRWPWPRKYHALLINKLVSYGAKVIAFDIFFTEPDRENPLSDNELIVATRKAKRVVHNAFFEIENGEIVNFNYPILPLRKVAAGVGYANIFPELDGSVRKIPIIKEYKGKAIPHLSLAAAALYLGEAPEEVAARVKTDAYNEMILNYCGGYNTFPYASFYDVISGKVEPKVFKDKIVVVGATATGLFDRHPQPFVPTFPGVETQATSMENILTGRYLRRASSIFTVLLTIISSAIPIFLLPLLSPLLSVFFTLSSILVIFLIGYILFLKNIYLEIVSAIFFLVVSYIIITIYRLFSEEREKRYIRMTFEVYVSPAVLNELLTNPLALSLGGVKKRLTVLFADIRDFTTIAETVSPEIVVATLNEYFTIVTEIIFKHGGTLNKFIGDAVMAFWGAPIPQEDHATRAVETALEMIEQVKVLQQRQKEKNLPPIDIGIGINTGEMVVGNMGSAKRMDYTVIGDSVNLAARLEPLNKIYKTHIIIGEETYKEIDKDKYEIYPLGTTRVKGKAEEVRIFELRGWKR